MGHRDYNKVHVQESPGNGYPNRTELFRSETETETVDSANKTTQRCMDSFKFNHDSANAVGRVSDDQHEPRPSAGDRESEASSPEIVDWHVIRLHMYHGATGWAHLYSVKLDVDNKKSQAKSVGFGCFFFVRCPGSARSSVQSLNQTFLFSNTSG